MKKQNTKEYTCKFCGHKQHNYLSKGYCVSCYQYFVMNNYKIFDKPKYGEISRVTDKNNKQYNMPICHICGRAYTKLQQHIYYAHKLYKNEYCDMYGLDHNVRLTTDEYNKRMSDYAYENNMDEQLREKGKNTRYRNGHNRNYKRSYMSKQRLIELGKVTGPKNLKRR